MKMEIKSRDFRFMNRKFSDRCDPLHLLSPDNQPVVCASILSLYVCLSVSLSLVNIQHFSWIIGVGFAWMMHIPWESMIFQLRLCSSTALITHQFFQQMCMRARFFFNSYFQHMVVGCCFFFLFVYSYSCFKRSVMKKKIIWFNRIAAQCKTFSNVNTLF